MKLVKQWASPMIVMSKMSPTWKLIISVCLQIDLSSCNLFKWNIAIFFWKKFPMPISLRSRPIGVTLFFTLVGDVWDRPNTAQTHCSCINQFHCGMSLCVPAVNCVCGRFANYQQILRIINLDRNHHGTSCNNNTLHCIKAYKNYRLTFKLVWFQIVVSREESQGVEA